MSDMSTDTRVAELTPGQLHVCKLLINYSPNTGPFRNRVEMPDWFGDWNGAHMSISPEGQAVLAKIAEEPPS